MIQVCYSSVRGYRYVLHHQPTPPPPPPPPPAFSYAPIFSTHQNSYSSVWSIYRVVYLPRMRKQSRALKKHVCFVDITSSVRPGSNEEGRHFFRGSPTSGNNSSYAREEMKSSLTTQACDASKFFFSPSNNLRAILNAVYNHL